MAAITGAQTNIVMKIGSVFGTGVAASATDKIYVDNIAMPRNVAVEKTNPIGSGQCMSGPDTQQGADDPKPSFVGDMHYNDAKLYALGQFFGGESVTGGGGNYAHSFLFNETANARWITIAKGPTSSEVMECTSSAVTKLTLSADKFTGPIKLAVDMIANDRKITGTANSWANMDAAAVADGTRIMCRKEDWFAMNAQAGAALSVADAVAFNSIEWSFEKPQSHVSECRGVAGNSEPRQDDMLKVIIKLNLRKLADFTYFTAAAAGTAYKGQWNVTGGTLGTGAYQLRVNLPYLKIVEDPDFKVANAGENGYAITLEGLVAVTAPTGMLDPYPHVIVNNGRATTYLA